MSSTIIDNGDAGYSTTGGTWSNTASGVGYGASAQFSHAHAGSTASWQFTGLTPAITYYLGHTWAKNAAWASAINLKVYDSDGTTVLLNTTFDETVDPADFTDTAANWHFLGGFAPTGTSLTITITDPGTGYTIADAALLTATLPNVAQVTVSAGNIQTGSNWNINSTPDFTKKIVLKHAMTMTVDQAFGDGTDNLFIDASDSNASLTVTGCVMELKGGTAQLGVNTYSSGMRTWLKLQSSGGNPAILRLNGNSGIEPKVLFGRQTRLDLIGDVVIETKSGSAGTQGYLGQYLTSVEYLSIDGSALTSLQLNRLGNVTHDGIKCDLANSASTLTLKHATVDANCINVPSFTMGNGAATLSLTDNTWANNSGQRCLSATNGGFAKTSGTWEILRNTFNGRPFFSSCRDVVVKHNFFNNYFEGNDDAVTWLWSFNFVRKSDGFETVSSGGCSSTFWLYDGASAGQAFVLVSRLSCTFDNNVFQRDVDGSVECIGMSEGGSQARDITIRNNIVLRSSAGGSSGQLASAFNNNAAGSNNPRIIPYHNSVWVPPGMNGIGIKGSDLERVGMLITGKSNIFARAGGSVTGTYGIGQDAASPAAALTDSVQASEINYNCNFGMDSVAAGHWSGTLGDTGVEDGSHDNSPMSGVTVPDLNAVNVDPQFVNGTALLEDYAVANGSVSGTAAGKRGDAMTYLLADLTRIETSLIPYFQSAFKVKNASLNNAGHDSVTIGAMAYQASTGPSYYEWNSGMHGGVMQLTGGFQRT